MVNKHTLSSDGVHRLEETKYSVISAELNLILDGLGAHKSHV